MFSLIKKVFAHKNKFTFVENPPASIEVNPKLKSIVTPLMQNIDTALNSSYKEKFFRNYQTKNPAITFLELEWRLFELKKYFFLTIVFKHVPMFSKTVDALWHEMILFTRDYDLFCDHLGVRIEHEPHLEPKYDPDERAFFDFIYSLLFQVNDVAKHFYGEFYRHSLSNRIRELINNDDLPTFLTQFVRDSEQSKKIATKLWEEVTQQIQEVSSSSEATNTNCSSSLEKYAYWMPTWFLIGQMNPDEKLKSDGGFTVHPADSSDSTAHPDSSCSSCSSCSGCAS